MPPLETETSLTTCVIGGTGFIGRAVVDELLSLGRNVIIVGRLEQPVRPLPAGVSYIATSTEGALQTVLARSQEIIDLAYSTVPQTSFQDPINDIVVNLPEAVRLFELASPLPIRKFVWVSSGGTVYGRTDVPLIAETHPTHPLSPYGITKLAIEKYAHMYFESNNLPIVCVRPSNAFGAWQRAYSGQGFIATAIASVLDRRELTLFGEHGTVRDYLYVKDMAAGIVAALLHGRPGEVYNVGSGQGLTNRQVLSQLSLLAADSGYKLRLRVAPPRPFDVPTNVLDNSKLKTETHWQPRMSFTQGLAQTWNWYVQLHNRT